jgi:hypothetical protein
MRYRGAHGGGGLKGGKRYIGCGANAREEEAEIRIRFKGRKETAEVTGLLLCFLLYVGRVHGDETKASPK